MDERLALKRHPGSRGEAVRSVAARVSRREASLELLFFLEGDLECVLVPPPAPARVAEGLWQHTCCEAFVAAGEDAGYREFNFSPSGAWAAYAFRAYREGGACTAPDPGIAVRRTGERLELAAAIAVPAGRLRLGLAAVIEERGGALAYWALAHPSGKPDFHHPAAFSLELP